MGTMLRSESPRLYSWWWDSHISPKNSKWLQENLTDMDAKVKEMIKLIEEDADSFARRAEMFYEKKPELMKLVEEFYRAYRALAEKYDHAMVELRDAHRIIAKAFPNQIPNMSADNSTPGSSAMELVPQTPEMPHPIYALNDFNKNEIFLSSSDLHVAKMNDSNSGTSQRGLKQINQMLVLEEAPPESSKLGDEKSKEYLNFIEAEEEKRCLLDQYSQLSNENQDIETRALSETEVMFAEMHTEKECLILKYKQNFEKLTSLENKISHAQRDAEVLEEQVNKAKNEIQKLKEALLNLEAERDAGHFHYKKCSERISDLEASISQAQENAKEINGRAVKAESESQYLKEEVARLEAEKDATFLRYKQCLEKISSLENIICLAEENEKMLSAQTDRAESEVKDLRQELAELAKEKEVAASRYEQCLNTISKLENEICHARKDAENVKSEVLVDAAKLKAAEKQCVLLGRLNLSLQLELENLAQKMVMKDQELSRRQEEVEKLQISLQDKQSQILQVQAALLTLEKVHSQSQGEQQSLALELRNGLQNVNNLQMCKIGLEEEIKHVKEENHTLNELNLASTISIENLQGEITGLRNMKQKLEEGILLQVDQNNLLEQEIRCLKEEIRDMKLAYEALLTQVKSAGIDPESLGQSLKELQEENLRLNEQSQEDKNEKEALSKKLENMEFFSDRNAALESSLLNSSKELEGSREKIRALQESCWFLQGEKSVLMVEKVGLFCQLHVITESRQKLLEKNTLLDNSLSAANNELETLRLKYKNLEQIQELLSSEKQEHARFVMSSETRLASLQEHVGLLQEKIRLRKKEFEHELDKAINTQVELFILQKFVKDLDEKNLSLLSECWRHVEASKLSDRIIADLESEKFEQQIEAEFLLNEIQKLRMGIYHVFTLLQDDPLEGHGNKMRHCILLPRIVRNIEDMRTSILENEEEGLQLLVENSVLLALIRQLKLEGSELESEKVTLDQKFCIMKKQIALLQKEKQELLEINRQFIAKVSKKEQEEKFLNFRLMSVQEKLSDSQGANFTLREENSKVLEENRFLLEELLGSKRENSMLEEENDVLLREAASLSYLSLIFQNFGTEKVVELEVLTEDQNCLKVVNGHLEDEVKVLGDKLEMKERQNLCLNISQAELEKKLHELRIMNDELCYYKFAVDNSLIQKERELSETEEKLQTAEKLAIEMERTIWGLNIEYEESRVINENLEKHVLELSEENNNLNREIEDLLQEKTNLEFELCVELCELHKEIEEREHKEDSLCSELQERGNELKLWEAEGEAFFFNLQTSSIRELLLESKVNELSFICENLRGESASKTVEIGQMKDRASLLEGEICELEARLSAYVPVIASLRNDLASLEHNALFQVIEATAGSQETNCQQLSENPADMILDLQNMRGKVKAIEKTLLDMGKGFSVHKSTTINKPEAATEQTVGSLLTCHQDIHRNKEKIGNRSIDNLRFKMAKSGGFVARNATLLKDITLDRVSGWSGNRSSTRRGGGPEDQMLWEAVGQNCVLNSPHATNTEKQVFGSEEDDSMSNQSESRSEKEMGLELFIGIRKSKQGKDKRKILERLNSDAQKLTGVEMVVRDLKRRMEINKKRKKTKKLDYPTMREQIREVEDALVQLADINGQLLRNFEDRRHVTEAEDARNLRREREEARRGSEKIGRLQLQVQRIQYLLLKLEDGKKSQGKKKLFKSKTTVLLKNLSPTGSQTRRRKKAYFCGWLRPPPNMGNQVTN